MHKNDLNNFFEGKLNLNRMRADEYANTIEEDFTELYKKAIEDMNAEVPEFNPFAKIEDKKHVSVFKRLLPYAASVLLVLSVFFAYQHYNSRKIQNQFSQQEIVEIQKNTEMVLLLFSKELNACMTSFEDAKALQESVSELATLKDINFNLNNPLKNLNLN